MGRGQRSSQAECDLHQAGSLEAGMDLLTARNHYNSGKFPLVVAASGLTREGADITNQRAGSRVEYATYADHASLQDFREPYASYFAGADNPIHIKPHTGTSVSSALLSTIVAATWSYDPELDVNLLMNAIYRTGEIVFDSAGNKVRAEFCHGKGSACTKVTKRLSMCQAIYGFDANRDGISDITGVDARTAVATHCEAWSAQLAVTPDTGAIAIPTTATSGAAPASSYETASVSQTHVYWSHAYTEGACDAGSQRLYPWSKTTGVWKKAKHYCPEQQFFTATAAPWTVPQPEGGGSDCGGACALFPSYNMLALSSSTDLALVSSPTLTVTTTAGTTSQYSLSVSLWYQHHAELWWSLNHVDQECEIQRKHRFVLILVAALSRLLKCDSGYGLRIGHSRILLSLSPSSAHQRPYSRDFSRLTSSYISLHRHCQSSIRVLRS